MTPFGVDLDYVAVVALFCIGLYMLVAKSNLLKKLLGLNIMETSVFAFVVTYGMAKLLDATIGLRVSDAQEEVGLDISEHAERAYA